MPDKVPVCRGVGAGAGLNSPVYLIEKSFLGAVISTPAFCFCRRQVPSPPPFALFPPWWTFVSSFPGKLSAWLSFLLRFSPHPQPHSPVCWAAVGTNVQSGSLYEPPL